MPAMESAAPVVSASSTRGRRIVYRITAWEAIRGSSHPAIRENTERTISCGANRTEPMPAQSTAVSINSGILSAIACFRSLVRTIRMQQIGHGFESVNQTRGRPGNQIGVDGEYAVILQRGQTFIAGSPSQNLL